jgi:8-amino-7-oxononanoate synthase
VEAADQLGGTLAGVAPPSATVGVPLAVGFEDDLGDQLRALEAAGLPTQTAFRERAQRPTIQLDGQTVLNFASDSPRSGVPRGTSSARTQLSLPSGSPSSRMPLAVGFEDDLGDQLRALEAAGLRRRLRSVDGAQGPTIQLDGRTVLNFASNNYLGLAAHSTLVAAAHGAIDESGLGAGASRLIAGNFQAHRKLEASLAAFHRQPAALLFNSGYQANVGAIQALAGPGDVIFSDALNHASLIDGCRLSRADVFVYRHADLDHLRSHLVVHRQARRRLVVTDTIFSMDGDLAPLGPLRALCDETGAVLVVDEAHATGVLGPSGRGLAALAEVHADVHLATLSKALGAFGAYASGSTNLIQVLMHRARSFVFTTALPPGVAAAADAALSLVAGPEGDRRRAVLRGHMQRFATGLKQLGLLAPGAGGSPIFPVLLGDPLRTMGATEALLAAGVYAQGIRPPTVPPGTSRLRFALMATHTPQDIDRALGALEALRLRPLES